MPTPMSKSNVKEVYRMLGHSTPNRYERNKVVVRPDETEEEAYARTVRQRTFRNFWGNSTEEERDRLKLLAQRRREREMSWVF